MKKMLLLFGFLAFFSLISSNGVYAAKITFGSHDKIIKIYDLPDTEDYTSSDGKSFDFGYKYTLFEVAYLPIFEKGEGQIVGYIDDENYVALSDSDIQEIAKTNNIKNLSALVELPFWDVWGGKIVAISIILLLVLLIIRNRNKGVNE